MKKRMIAVLFVLLLALSACYPYHDVNVKIDMTNEYSGTFALEFDLASSVLDEDETLESVQTKLMALLTSDNRLQSANLDSQIGYGYLFITYEESFSDKASLEALLGRLSGSKVVIEEETESNPILRESIITGIEDEVETYIQWVYDAIKTQQLFGSNSNSIATYLEGDVTVSIDGESYDADGIRKIDPESIDNIKQTFTYGKEGLIGASIDVAIKDSTTIDVDAIKAFYDTVLKANNKAMASYDLSVSEKDGLHHFVIDLVNIDDYYVIYLYEDLFDGALFIDVIDFGAEDYDKASALSTLKDLNVDVTKESEVEDYYYFDFYMRFSGSQYADITDRIETIIDFEGLDIVNVDGEAFESLSPSDSNNYNGNVFSSEETYIINEYVLVENNSFMNIVWLIVKIIGGLLAAAALVVAGIFISKKVKANKAASAQIVNEAPTPTVNASEGTPTTQAPVVDAPKTSEATSEPKDDALVNAKTGFESLHKSASGLMDVFKKAITRVDAYIPLAAMIVCLLVIAVLFLVIFKGIFINFMQSSGYSGLDNLDFLSIISMIIPTGIKYVSSAYDEKVVITIFAGLLTFTTLVYVGGQLIAKQISRLTNKTFTNDEVFAHNMISLAVYLVIVMIFSFIPRTMSYDYYFYSVDVTTTGLFLQPLFTTVILGTLCSYFTAYGLKQSFIVNQKIQAVLKFALQKIAMMTVLTLIFSIYVIITQQTVAHYTLFLNLLVFMFLVGLGGSVAISMSVFNSVMVINLGALWTDGFSIMTFLFFLLTLCFMFFDVKRLYKETDSNNPITFAGIYAGVTTGSILVLGSLSSISMNAVGMTMGLGINFLSLVIVAGVTFGMTMLMLVVLKDVPLIDQLTEKYDQIMKAITGSFKKQTPIMSTETMNQSVPTSQSKVEKPVQDDEVKTETEKTNESKPTEPKE